MNGDNFRTLSWSQAFLRARVLAAFLAARDRLAGPFVFAAFRAAADLSAEDRFRAAARLCLDKAFFDTDDVGSSFRRLTPARERFFDIGSWR